MQERDVYRQKSLKISLKEYVFCEFGLSKPFRKVFFFVYILIF